VRHNYQPSDVGDVTVTESYKYFNHGDVKEKTTRIDNQSGLLQSFKQNYSYNDLGQTSTLTYPSCNDATRPCGAGGLSSISPVYQNGWLTQIPNFATISYAPSGMPSAISHVGGVTDTVAADPSGMRRPQQITFATYDSCSVPTITQQPADANVNFNQSTNLNVSASGSGTLTYQWFKDGSLFPACTGSTCATGALTANAKYVVWVSNSCGKATSREATVSVCGTPSVTVTPSNTAYSGSPVTLTATPSGCGPFTYQWYIGVSGNTSTPTGSNSPTLNTGTLTATRRYWVKLTDNVGGTANSNTAAVTIPLPTPGSMTATLNGTNAIKLQWLPSQGADHYRYQRFTQNSWSQVVDAYPTDPQNPWVLDSNLSLNTTYVYRVWAVDAFNDSASAYTPNDLASTLTYLNIQSNAGIFFNDFDHVLSVVNTVRGASGQGPLTWSQALIDAGYPNTPLPAQNAPILARHLLALRAAMNAALQAVGVAQPSYTDNLSTPTPVRALHLRELQQRAQ
jgi:hypothetical protein